MKESGPGINNLEAITSVNELGAENTAEKIEWLKHKCSGIATEKLFDMVSVGQAGLREYKKYAERQTRMQRGIVQDPALTLGDLDNIRYGVVPKIKQTTEHSFYWLIGDDNGMAKKMPLESAIEVFKEELVLRFKEALHELGDSVSVEQIQKMQPSTKPEMTGHKEGEERLRAAA